MQDAGVMAGATGPSRTGASRAGTEPLDWSQLALAVGGPAALGACVGLKADVAATLTMAAALPLVLVGVVAVTLPGLYVACSMLGAAPRASLVGRAALGAGRDVGVMMLGMAPATLFVAASLPGVDHATVICSVSVALCALVGARAFSGRLQEVMLDRRSLVVYPIWMLLSLGLGWQFYLMALRLGGLL